VKLARTITFVGLGTALRHGELLALRWRDVRMLEGLLQVREALVAGKFTTPKSRSSRRTIELGPRTLALLQEHRQASAYQGDDELVFSHPMSGKPLDPSRLSRCFMRPALRHAGIEKPFRPFHDLRHTALTHEAAAGNPQAYVQLKAGHSQGAITERYTYTPTGSLPRRRGARRRAYVRIWKSRASVTFIARTPLGPCQARTSAAEIAGQPCPDSGVASFRHLQPDRSGVAVARRDLRLAAAR
jgi:integrase